MQRYFINKNQIKNNQVIMSINDSYHIDKVMRMKINDKIVIVVNEVGSFLCNIIAINQLQIIAELVKPIESNNEMPLKVTIAHGLVRREKMEDTVEKLTELGTSAYYPVIMKRSNVKFLEERFDKRLIRLKKIIKEASEQSHRIRLMDIFMPITFKELILMKKHYDYALYAYEEEDKKSIQLKKIIKDLPKNLLVVIGPEGGFDESEVIELNQAGFIPISLGPRILRTEVAPIFVLSALSFAFELGDNY